MRAAFLAVLTATALSACAGGGNAGSPADATSEQQSGYMPASSFGQVGISGASRGALVEAAPPGPALPLLLHAGPDLTAPIINDSGSFINGPIILGSNTGAAGIGIEGATSGTGGYGVYGVAQGSGYIGVYGKATTPGGYGLYGYSSQGDGIRGYSASASGYGGYFSNGSASGVGLASAASTGNAIDATTQSGKAVFGEATIGGTGVYGEIPSTSSSGVAEYGDDQSSTGGYALYAYSQNGNGAYIASDSNVGLPTLHLQSFVAEAPPIIVDGPGSSKMSLDASGNMILRGNLIVDGTITSPSGTGPLITGRSHRVQIENVGDAQLVDGSAYVRIDPDFARQLDATQPYHVFVTPDGDSNQLYVAERTGAGFTVRESRHGTSTVGFDYRIVGAPLPVTLAKPLEARLPKSNLRPLTPH